MCLYQSYDSERKGPQDVTQWFSDYFELKTILTSGSIETWPLPITTIYRTKQTFIY